MNECPLIGRFRLPWADGGVGGTVAIVDGVGPTQRASALLMSGGRHVDILRRDGVGFGVVTHSRKRLAMSAISRIVV